MSDRVSSIPVDPGGDEGPVATQEHGRQEKTSDNSRDASSAEDLISLSRAGLNPQAAAFSCCKQSAKASSPLDTIPVSAVAALEVPVPSATSPPVACRDVMQCCSMQSPPLLADVPALSSSRLSSPRSSTGIGSPRGSEPGSERHAWSSSERTTIPLVRTGLTPTFPNRT